MTQRKMLHGDKTFPIDGPVVLNGEGFEAAQEIGFATNGFVLSLLRPGGGSLFTVIPISSRAYRKQKPTKAGFWFTGQTSVAIFDDWGTRHDLIGPRDAIKRIVQDCHRQGLRDYGSEAG